VRRELVAGLDDEQLDDDDEHAHDELAPQVPQRRQVRLLITTATRGSS